MHVLFLNRSYHPDVEATGQLLGELCTDLAKEFEVSVIAGRPNFVATQRSRFGFCRERHGAVNVWRVQSLRFDKSSLLSRAVGLLTYLCGASILALFLRKPDVVVVETDPPVLGLVGGLLKRWHGCRLVVYLQDLFPEVGLAMGKLQPGLLTKTLYWSTQVGLRQADRIVVLGEDMKARLAARQVQPRKVSIVPNWADTAALRQGQKTNEARREWARSGEFLVAYSGNLGLSQNLEPLIRVAAELRSEPVQFVLIGEGAMKARLERLVAEYKLTNVRFSSYVPKERLGESLAAPDLHYLPLRRGLAGCIVPSKLYGILAAGRPYVAAVEEASDVAAVTRRHQTGLVIGPEDEAQLLQAIRWSMSHPQELLREMGQRGRHLAETEFDRPLAAQRFSKVLHQVRNGG